MKKPIFEIKVNSWNKRTKREQEKALTWIYSLLWNIHGIYSRTGIADNFTGKSE